MANAWRWRPHLVSVVVPTRDRLATLELVLDGLARQTAPTSRFEVIVVDDGSSDGTPERLAADRHAFAFSLTVLRQENRGPAAARNRGLQTASGDVVLFIDDDCIPLPDLIERHLVSHETEELGVIGRIVWDPTLMVTPFMAFTDEEFFTYHQIRSPQDAPFACYFTGNASVHRASALAVRGFDEDFPYALHEDVDFAYRLRRQGMRFVFAPDAIVHHHRPATLGPTLEQRRRAGREIMRFWSKHPELRELTPFYGLTDPAWRRGFYRDVMAYYVALGLQEGTTHSAVLDTAEVLPDDFRDEAPLVATKAARRLDNVVDDTRRSHRLLVQETEILRRRSHDLEARHQQLARAYADQEADISALLDQLAARRSGATARELARRAWHRMASKRLGKRTGERP